MLKLKKNRGQSALEYSVLIGVVVAALVGMQIYMKHSYEGKLRSSIDEVGKQSDVAGLEIDITTNTTSESLEVSTGSGNTFIYTGYDENGNTAGAGAPQVTTVVQSSTETVPPYNANDPLF